MLTVSANNLVYVDCLPMITKFAYGIYNEHSKTYSPYSLLFDSQTAISNQCQIHGKHS